MDFSALDTLSVALTSLTFIVHTLGINSGSIDGFITVNVDSGMESVGESSLSTCTARNDNKLTGLIASGSMSTFSITKSSSLSINKSESS